MNESTEGNVFKCKLSHGKNEFRTWPTKNYIIKSSPMYINKTHGMLNGALCRAV
jgi:hypothetical protein